jgi:RHS repeat-associated protein
LRSRLSAKRETQSGQTSFRSLYVPNTSAYIVGLAGDERLYSGTALESGNLVKQTLYYYDDTSNSSAAPTVGNLTRTDAWDDQTGGYVTSRQQYDAYGNITQVTDPRGATTTTTYDPTYHLFPVRTCNALNHCVIQTWDAALGVLTTNTDSNAATTSYAYDALGRKTSETDAAGNTTTWQYLNTGDPNKQHVRITRPDGSSDGLWSDTYTDGLGRTYKVVKEGPGAGLTYEQDTAYSDATERIHQQSLWRQSGDAPLWESYAYDGAGRLVQTTHPDGSFSTIQYAVDASAIPYEIMRDELGHERASWEDAYGNTSQVREQNGADQYITRYAYNPLDKLVSVVDQAGNTTTFEWDSLSRKVAMRDPDLGAWSYAYDAGSLLLTQTDAKNQTTTFTYDALGRMKTKLSGGQTTSWFYDEEGYGASIGRLTQVVYSAGSERHTWNNLGLETETTRCVETTCQTTSQTYDALQRPNTQTYPDGEVVSYTYDDTGNLRSVSGYVDGMTWSPSGQLSSLTYANGTTTHYTYDPKRLWLLTAAVNHDTTTLYTAAYTYDVAGLVKTATHGTPDASTLSYAYDELNRLTGVSGAQTQTFSYDALGNMTSNSLIGSYIYDDPAHKHAVTAAGANTYAYDANGNMTSGAGRTLSWDAQNRLTGTTQGETTTTFAYDAGEQRIKKTQGATTTLYFSRLVERVNGSLIQYYYAGPILVAKKDAGGTKTWYHADRLGSIRLMTDASGSEVKEYDYQAFGQTQSSSGAMSNERGYTGHITDGETGLIYMVARYYDAQLGRFLSADTFVSDWTNPQDLNPYSYVVNNPISNTDPTGHAPRLAPPWMFEDEHWQVEKRSRRSRTRIPDFSPADWRRAEMASRHIQVDVAASTKTSGWRKGLGTVLDLSAFIADVHAFSLTVVGGVAATTVSALDGPAPAADLAAAGFYKIFDRAENIMGGISFGATALSDIVTRDTYLDRDRQELVIGQDTLVSGGAALLGTVELPHPAAQSVYDTTINTYVLVYDARGLAGNPMKFNGKTWEMRVNYGSGDWRPFYVPVGD